MNSISVSGRVAQPQARELANGNNMLTFSVAENQYVNGEDVTVWYRCALFGKRAKSLESLVVKGASVTVLGRLQPKSYTNNSGDKLMNLNIVANDIYIGSYKSSQKESGEKSSQDYEVDATLFTDDEIPF